MLENRNRFFLIYVKVKKIKEIKIEKFITLIYKKVSPENAVGLRYILSSTEFMVRILVLREM